MNPTIQWLNEFSGPWAGWIWRATWQGAVVIGVAWLLTVVLARQSPRFRSWIWRLAYVKLLVLLIWTTPLGLAVLPAAEGSGFGVQGSDQQGSGFRVQGSDQTAPGSAVGQVATDGSWTSADSGSAGGQVDDHDSTLADRTSEIEGRGGEALYRSSDVGMRYKPPAEPGAGEPYKPPAEPGAATRLSPISYVFLVWLFGVAFAVAWLVIETLRALRLRRGAQPINRPDVDLLAQEVCRKLKLRPRVQLAQSHLAAGPMLVKFLRPRIIFPSAMVDQLSPEEIRLVLAHELAHIKRRDLAWNALAAVVHIALYFHPLVWLAHRLSRREQELACDELVVTRLAVERHDYGQMLVRVLRQITGNFRSGVATLGMSGSYKTLSRRLEAMKAIRQFSRKQITAAALALTLLAAISIVPWRLVAQERVPAAKPAPVGRAAPGAKQQEAKQPAEPAKTTAANTDPQKLIVGTWRGKAAIGELVLNKDGTYQQFARMENMVPPAQQYVNENGKWQIQDNNLALSAEAKSLAMRGLPNTNFPMSGGVTRQFKVVRLDDELLRLQEFFVGGAGFGQANDSVGSTLFYRRVDPKTAPPDFDPSLPAELREIAQAARLTPKDAMKMVYWFPAGIIAEQTGKPLHWELAGRVVKARRGHSDFSELFNLTADEAKSYLDLLKLAGSYSAACSLADDGQLAPRELSAINKLKAFRDDFAALGTALDSAMHGMPTKTAGGGLGGGGGFGITAENAEAMGVKDEFEAGMKLKLFLDDLSSYLNYTVFLDPQTFGGASPFGPPGR